MPLASIIGGGAASIGGGILGNILSSGDRNAALNNFQQIVNQYQNMGVPSAQALQVAFQQVQNAGQMTPELQNAIQQQGTQLSNIQTNPAYSGAQMNALQSLQNIAGQGGMNLQDKANLAQTMQNVGVQNQGAQQAILANAQQRGQLGSGNSLAAQLSAQQNGANQANLQGLNIAGNAQQRALQSLMGAGQLGGQMQQQQYGQQANAAQAQDAINRFNTMNSQAVQNQNVQAQNQAQAMNLQNQQGLNYANTGIANQQALQHAGALQQNYNDQLQKNQGLAGAYTGQAGALNQNANQTAGMFAGAGSGLGQMGTGVSSYLQNQGNQQQQQQNFNQWMNAAYPQAGGAAGFGSY